MTEAEFQRYIQNIWDDAKVPLNPGSGLFKHWRDKLRGGNYLGRPERQEHPTESGAFVLQEFGSAILNYNVATGEVKEGLPPFH